MGSGLPFEGDTQNRLKSFKYGIFFRFAFAGDSQNLYYGFPENQWEVPGYMKVAPDFVKKAITDPAQRTNQPDLDSFIKTTQ